MFGPVSEGFYGDSDVQLTPNPVPGRPLDMTDIDLESRAIDEQMDGPIGGQSTKSDITSFLRRLGSVV